MADLRRPELLDPGKHFRANFDCGVASLDTWLKQYAGQNRRRDTAATWVMSDVGHHVVAYASLSMSSVDLSAAPVKLRQGAPAQVPALLLGRLAVDQRHRGEGIGTEMVKHVLLTALELNAKAACRAVVVDALDQEVRSWYQRLGFTPFADDPAAAGYLSLYLLTSDIEQTLLGNAD